ncbi:MAG: RNA polymerase sigma factor [Planctomycetes bacterium]|nr:RNA polymerase sigma factor [Planctomycetota bacterium]
MPEPELDLPACIARVLAGDPAAARALVEHCHPLVQRLVRAHRPRSVAAADLVQDVFTKMFAHLSHYAPRAALPFEHWLARIAVNTCRDALRGEARRADAIPITPAAAQWLDVLVADPAPAAHDALAARELVLALLAELPPDDRLVLTLLDMEERSVAETAAFTGWSRSGVKVRAFRARLRLRAIARRRAEDARG